MKGFYWHLLSVAMIALLLGCATLSKNECLEADWFEIGRKDGMMGKPCALFQEHVDACIKYGIRPNRNDYYAGRDMGLNVYCTENNGFEQGRRGKKYQYVCPPGLEPAFLNGFNQGMEIYNYESKVASLERRLKRIEEQIEDKKKKLHSSKLSDKKRATIYSEIMSLEIEYRDAVRELTSLAKTKPPY